MTRWLNIIDKTNATLAGIAKWCALGMMLLQAFSVIMRYVFSYGSIAVQEAVIYGHAILFLFGAAFILQSNEHVRVEVFYSKFSIKTRHIINLLTQLLFVLPLAVTILFVSYPYVLSAWQTLESSRQVGGLPLIFLLKTSIWIFAISLASQTLAISTRLFSGSTDSHWTSQPETNQAEASEAEQ